MAESLIKDKNLKSPKDIALNHFIKEWEEEVKKDYKEHEKNFVPDLEQSISTFFNYEVNLVLKSADSVKDLPNEFIDKLKSQLFLQIFWGYLSGVTEAKYRK